ncbi:MAG: DNA polymerase IV [Tenericutes bacterium]|nr:DNA polymerase IV [Mycoplasmatota bacterium]
MKERLIFHIDVNNAFLSWTAVDLLKNGYSIDIRTIPSVIGGDEDARRGIVTAKSPVAKKMGVVSAEPLYMARRKCPNLKVFKGDYELYHRESNKLYKYFCTLTDRVERFSIDECFLDMSGTNFLYPDPIKLAYQIKDEIYNKFGYTVNIGIANNKLCAKMASDFEKPNKVHTLFNYEIEKKMWPLPVEDLFMVGKSSSKVLREMGITTIGALAHTDLDLLKRRFKSQGEMMKNYANGIDFSPVNPNNHNGKSKSMSVTETMPKDVESTVELKKILMKQAERISRQARKEKVYAQTVALIFKTSDFISYSHQIKLVNPTNVTADIYNYCLDILSKGWRGEPLRLIGIRLADFTNDNRKQISIFDQEKDLHADKMQEILDDISNKYGDGVIIPASLKNNN